MPSAYICFIMLFLVVALGFGGAPVFYDPDTAWHLAAGDLIRQHHKIPFGDRWSFTGTDDIWYNLSWLFDTWLSFLLSWGGFSAVYAFTILVFAGCMTCMATHCIKTRGTSITITLALLIPLALVLFTGTLARPNMCSVAMTIAFYLILHHYSKNGKPFYISLLPILMALWVNLHGGFLFAFPLLAFFFAQAIGDKNLTAQKTYIIICGLCLFATLINPYGFGVYYGAYKTIAAPFNTVLTEWKPVEIGHNLQMTLLLVVILCTANFSDRKIPFADRAIALFVILLALSSMRHSIIASLLLMPYLSLRMTDMAYRSRWAEKIRKRDAGIMADMQKTDIRVMAACMLLGVCVLLYIPTPRDEILKEPVGFSEKHFPVQEAEFIARKYPRLRFFNDYNIGGYLDYIWRGRVKVFIDGRANSLYSDDVLNDYKDFMESGGFGGRAEMIQDTYKFDGLIIANDSPILTQWSWNPDWKIVYKGKAATVFVKSK